MKKEMSTKSGKLFTCAVVFVLALCAGSRVSHAFTDDQKSKMQAVVQKLVKQRQDELQAQQSELDQQQEQEDEDARDAKRKLEYQEKLARYWIARLKSQHASEAQVAEWLNKLKQYEAEKGQQQQVDAQREKEHKRQQEAMKQKLDEEAVKLEAAQTRFNAAMLRDKSNDYDYALGTALGAYSNPNWTPEDLNVNRCQVVNGDVNSKTSSSFVILKCDPVVNQ